MVLLRFLWIGLILLAGCTKPSTGSLKIGISGLPSGTNADISVTGPPSYSKKVTGSTTLSNLTPGTYTLSVTDVSAGAVAYTSSGSLTVQISANATASADIEYFAKNVDENSANNDSSSAQLLRYGMNANAAIETPGDQDWYRFVAKAGDFVKIDIDARTLSDAWGSGDSANAITLELFNADSPPTRLALSDATSTISVLSSQYNPPGDPIITHLIDQAGTYYLRATSRFSNIGSPNHKYVLKLIKTAVPWANQTLRIAAGHLKNYEKGPDGIVGVSILGNAVVDIFDTSDSFNPTGKFSYSVSGPPGWNGGAPYNGSVEFFGHQAAIAFLKDSDVSPTTLGELPGPTNKINIARVEPLQFGTYTLSIDVHGKTLTKSFSLNSVDALPLPQNIKVTPANSTSLKVSWDTVSGAKKYVIFVYRPDGSLVPSSVTAPTTSTVVDQFIPLQTGGKYNVQVYAHDFNFLVDTLGGKYNKSGNLATEFTYVAP